MQPVSAALDAAELNVAPRGIKFTTQENNLIHFLLNDRFEKPRVKKGSGSVDWDGFKRRWKYFCQVETVLGFGAGYYDRSINQLKERLKTMKNAM